MENDRERDGERYCCPCVIDRTVDFPLGGMGHLSILRWIKVYKKSNIFTILEFSNFNIWPINMFLNIFEKVIQMHGLQICRFHCNPMHTLLGNNSKEEKIYKITGILDFIVYFIQKNITIWKCLNTTLWAFKIDTKSEEKDHLNK